MVGWLAQEAARKDVLDVKDISDSHEGEKSESIGSGGVKEVKRDNRKSRCHFQSEVKITQDQAAGGRKRCHRCGLTNHTPDNFRHKGTECYKCRKTGHLQSECPNVKPPPKQWSERQHVRHAEQDCGEQEESDLEDDFNASI